MTTFLKIAYRNIIRHRYRSLLTLGAVALGIMALAFVVSFFEGMDSQLIENFTNLVTGQIQVHERGFHRKMGLNRSIENTAHVEGVLSSVKGITFTKRIKEYMLISSDEKSAGVLLMGVDSRTEQKVSDLHTKIREGAFFENSSGHGIIIGKKLKSILAVQLGDTVALMGQAADGSIAAENFKICGIIETGADELDKNIVLIELRAAQRLLAMDNKISEFTLRVDDVFHPEGAADEIRGKLADGTCEVLSWKEILPQIHQMVQFHNAFFQIVLIIFLVMVGMGIMNTVLISILERIREFGIMIALGTKRKQIVLLVFIESILYGIIGTLLGIILSLAMNFYLSRVGIDLACFGLMTEAFHVGTVIYTKLLFGKLVVCSTGVFLVSIFIAVFPAFKAAYVKPVAAIRQL